MSGGIVKRSVVGSVQKEKEMTKKYFIRYLEGRERLCVASSPTMVITKSFDAGLRLTRNCGYDRKRDAIRNAEEINRAAGKIIAEYAGSFEPQPMV